MRWIALIAIGMALLFAVSARAALPEAAGDWSSTDEYVKPFVLAANSEDVGRWTRRVYTRAAPPASVEVNLMEGSGPGPLRVPDTVGSSDAVIEAQAEYRVLEVAGHRAVLERYPYLPLALAVDAGGGRALTLESGAASEEELAELAGEIIKNLVEGE